MQYKPRKKNCTTLLLQTIMDRAKETLGKVAKAAEGTNQTSSASTGFERDLEPKPTKVHMQGISNEELGVYSPSDKLKGRNALITGGDSGIGRSIAILFAMEGAKIAIVYLPDEEEDAQHTKAQVKKNGGHCTLIASDLKQEPNCRDVAARVVQAFGGIDILVNNAATRQEGGGINDITE